MAIFNNKCYLMRIINNNPVILKSNSVIWNNKNIVIKTTTQMTQIFSMYGKRNTIIIIETTYVSGVFNKGTIKQKYQNKLLFY